MTAEATGTLQKIVYQKDDFVIGLLMTKDEAIKIIGSIYGVHTEEKITVWGAWETHPKFGRQLKVESWERPMPQTEEQVLAFLSSPMVKGCGKKSARDIVGKLGKDALSIISEQGEACLSSVRNIGRKRAEKIVTSVKSTFEVQKVISQLLVYGITANMALKAYKEYGSGTVDRLTKNPYELTNLNLVGFQKADEIAQKIGVMPTSGYRMEACLKYVLKKLCFQAGHTYVPKETLIHDTLLALNHNAIEKVTEEELENSLMCSEEKFIVNEDDCIFPKFLHQNEERLARKLSKMGGSRNGGAMPSLKKHIKQHQKKNQIVLAEKQKDAIVQLFAEQLLVLTGGPGTGKTTVIRAMMDIYQEMYPKNTIKLVAPTGRAARKLSQVAKHEAATVHRLIGYRKGQHPIYDHDNQLACDLLIIDEMSMVDVVLANNLLQALHDNTKVLFIGDMDQLPSIAPGNVLKDLIQSGLPTVALTEVFRQARGSQIIHNAHRMNQGKSLLIDDEKDDFFFIPQENPSAIAQLIVRSAERFREKGYGLSDILVLSPMKKGEVGTSALNEMLRNALNPVDLNKKEWQVGKKLFRAGDKVIQTKNNYDKEVYNGDMGMIQSIATERNDDGEEIRVLKINFAKTVISYYQEDLKELELAYAVTIHKAQGGEAPVVIIPVTSSHYMMLARNLIYTGMTRAKEKLVFIGTKKAVHMAIHNDNITSRNSRLVERLNACTVNMRADKHVP